jgi:hypothetical protein
MTHGHKLPERSRTQVYKNPEGMTIAAKQRKLYQRGVLP